MKRYALVTALAACAIESTHFRQLRDDQKGI
jgi:hypothetical protein